MKSEIERKFFVKTMPDLSGVRPLRYERYFLSRSGSVEERVSKVDDKYFFEKKNSLSNIERIREKKEIPKEEFEMLTRDLKDPIIRDRYDIAYKPDVVIQIYHGRFEGLVRAEVEFDSAEEATAFIPFAWMGKEMSDLPIARDSKLLDFSQEDFCHYLSLGKS